MNSVVVIAVGGALGALSRYWITAGVGVVFGRGFPFGTLAVNVLGSLLIGILFVWIEHKAESPLVRQAVITGFLGSLTTFSTFSLETLHLMEAGAPGRALMNVAANVILCIVAVTLGILAARTVIH